MDQLIPVVNKLQDVFGAIGQQTIDLPQIVVVGSQSAGKSSVLESIVGRDFLPRGSGIVTRCPLILQLYSIHEDNRNKSEIRNEIIRQTDSVAGGNKGISNKSINLKIFSPHVLNLTLVDLPGITKVPTGDQPMDIEQRILDMCLEFISKPNAVILAVSAANQDLANSESLKLARAVDPDGDRTVGVLTKIDLMDAGTDACDILNNKVISLRRGYVGVINRSQKDINDGVSIRDGLAKEQNYFQRHHHYRNVASRCGTHHLARTLNQVLMQHIRECLPDIKTRIASMLIDTQMNLDGLGESASDSNATNVSSIMLAVLSNFANNFSSNVDGKGMKLTEMETSELIGGARISYIFNEIFGKSLRALNPFDGLDDEDIRTAIANANGPRPALFVPEISFDLLVKRQISRLEQPGQQCADMVFDEMQRMAFQSEGADMSRFPDLRDKIFEVVNSVLRRCMGPTQKMISNLIQVELAYINTSHPDFIGGKQAVAQLNRRINQGTANPQSSPVVSTSNGPSSVGTAAVTSSGATDSTTPPTPPASLSQSAATSSNASSAKASSTPPPPSQAVSSSSHTGAADNSNRGFLNLFRGPTTSSSAAPPSVGVQNMAIRDNHRVNIDVVPYPSKTLKLPQVPDRMRPGNPSSDKERVETEIIKSLIASYFEIVKKNFIDLVPKTIMNFLVNDFKNSIQNELVTELYKETLMKDLMRETAEVADRRRELKENRDLLRRALEIVNEVRDFNTFNK